MNLPAATSSEHAKDLLAGTAWLRSFPQDLREEFITRCKLLPPFERGQRVFNIGDRPDGIYGVVSGCFVFEACEDVAVKVRHLRWVLPPFLRMVTGSCSFSG